jgi:nitroreductase
VQIIALEMPSAILSTTTNGAMMSNLRNPAYPIDKIFVNRWSPRAMSGEQITKEELMTLFEAARWAPSSYNGQPWRFVYAYRDTENWAKFFALLGSFNQAWCKNAGVLIVVVSRKTFDANGKPSRTHAFDTGAAWENLALQGSIMGLVCHGMEGFDYERAAQVIKMPEAYAVHAMLAIGKPGPITELPADLQAREVPSDRKPVGDISFEGSF